MVVDTYVSLFTDVLFLRKSASLIGQNAPPESNIYHHERGIAMDGAVSTDTNGIKNWRSIVTLIVFILTSKYRVSLTRYFPCD
jgi:hypothetical protein